MSQPRSTVRANFLSNLIGQGWTSVLGLAFVPLYVHLLGVESYGLIGFFAVLHTWLSLLDLGMTQTLTRKIASENDSDLTVKESRFLLRTLETTSLIIGIITVVVGWFLSDWIATSWLNLKNLDPAQVSTAIALMGVVCGERFLENVYRAFLIGTQRQVSLNVISALSATVRHVGAFAVLYFYSADVVTFFVWQAAMSTVTVIVFGMYVTRIAPNRATTFSAMRAQIKGAYGFASSMAALNILALILGQLDKVFVSRLVSLDQFGYYILASTVATGLHQLTMPVAQAYFPRFAQLYFAGRTNELTGAFHSSARLVATLICAAASLLILFPHEVIFAWTKNEAVAASAAPLLTLLALATMLNGLMWIPYHLQLAAGWTKLMLKVNGFAVVLVVPAMIYSVKQYGVMAAAWISVALNLLYVLVVAHFMHQRLLPGEKWSWYRDDVMKPMISALAIALVCRLLPVWGHGYASDLRYLVLTALAVFAFSFGLNPTIRVRMIEKIRGFRDPR